MKATPEQKQKAAKFAYESGAYRHAYIGGREGVWLFHYPTNTGKPSEMLTMEEMEAKADAGK